MQGKCEWLGSIRVKESMIDKWSVSDMEIVRRCKRQGKYEWQVQCELWGEKCKWHEKRAKRKYL